VTLLVKLPKLEAPSLTAALEMVEDLQTDIIETARGNKAARTRLRVKIMKAVKLLQQARKEIAPATKGLPMQKFGVHEDKDAEKLADDKSKCPKCGATVSTHGSITLCPNCGSEPYETNEEQTPEKQN